MAAANAGCAGSARKQPSALMRDASGALARAGVENPPLDAELLLAHALGVERGELFSWSGSVGESQTEPFWALLDRRLRREPLAYILGRKEFFSLDFEVGPAVLIPRPETELLVEETLRLIAARPSPRVLDLGTGSGAIAIAVAACAERARVLATDVSSSALMLARRNAARHGCASRVEFAVSDLWEGLCACECRPRFDVIVSNPPYVTDAELEALAPEVRDYEPSVALAGGADGLDLTRRIVAGARNFLLPAGALVVEAGAGQSGMVAELMRSFGLARVLVKRDLAGVERAVVGFASDSALAAREIANLTARPQ